MEIRRLIVVLMMYKDAGLEKDDFFEKELDK